MGIKNGFTQKKTHFFLQMFSKKYLVLGLNYGQDKANTNPPAENSLGIA